MATFAAAGRVAIFVANDRAKHPQSIEWIWAMLRSIEGESIVQGWATNRQTEQPLLLAWSEHSLSGTPDLEGTLTLYFKGSNGRIEKRASKGHHNKVMTLINDEFYHGQSLFDYKSVTWDEYVELVNGLS